MKSVGDADDAFWTKQQKELYCLLLIKVRFVLCPSEITSEFMKIFKDKFIAKVIERTNAIKINPFRCK
jgi:hypothetical protein